MAAGVSRLLRWLLPDSARTALRQRLARLHAGRAVAAAVAQAASRRAARASVHEWGWFTIYLPGTEIPLFARPGTSDLQSFKAIFGRRQHDLGLDDAPRTIVDLGANVGYATVDFALRFPAATIVAVEPESSNVDVLRLNTSSFAKVHVVQAAAWPRPATLAVEDVGNQHWGFQVREAVGAETAVRAVTVPELMELIGAESIDLLKVDIEGAEHELLSENVDWLEHVRALVIEFHRVRDGATAASEAVLSRYGFEQRGGRDENRYYARPPAALPDRRRLELPPRRAPNAFRRRRQPYGIGLAVRVAAAAAACFVVFGLIPEALGDRPYNPFGKDSRAQSQPHHH